MNPFEYIVRRMMDALLASVVSGTATCPRSMVAEAQRLRVNPVAAERLARLRLAVQ